MVWGCCDSDFTETEKASEIKCRAQAKGTRMQQGSAQTVGRLPLTSVCMYALKVLGAEGQQSGTESFGHSTAVMNSLSLSPELCSRSEFTLKFSFTV